MPSENDIPILLLSPAAADRVLEPLDVELMSN